MVGCGSFSIKWSWLDVMSWCCDGGLRLAAVAAAKFLRCFNEKFDKKGPKWAICVYGGATGIQTLDLRLAKAAL